MTVLFVLFIFLLLFFGSCFWVYRFGFYSPNRTQNDDFAVAVVPKGDPRRPAVEAMIAAVRELPYESVSIRSHDGLRLCGRYIHQHDGAPLDICFHGYRGTPARDFSGGTQIILREGHNLLMIEERSHCSSES